MKKANIFNDSRLKSEDDESNKDEDIEILLEYYEDIYQVILNLFLENEQLTQKEKSFKTILADITTSLEASLTVYTKRSKNQKLTGEYYLALKEAEDILETAVDKCLQGVENKDAFLFDEVKKQAITPLRLDMATLQKKITTLKKDIRKSRNTIDAHTTEINAESTRLSQQLAKAENTVNLLKDTIEIFSELYKELGILSGKSLKPKYGHRKSFLKYKPFSITDGSLPANETAQGSPVFIGTKADSNYPDSNLSANDLTLSSKKSVENSLAHASRPPVSVDELDTMLKKFHTPKDLAKSVLEDNSEKNKNINFLCQKIEMMVEQQSKITDLNNRANQFVRDYNTHLKQVSEEVSESHKTVSSIQKIGRFFTVNNTDKIIASLRQKIDELKQRYEELADEASTLSKKIAEQEGKLMDLRKKNEDIEDRNKNLSKLYGEAYYACINARQCALLLTLEGTVATPHRSVSMKTRTINYGVKGVDEMLDNLNVFPK